MSEFFKNHKKSCTLAVITVVLVLFVVYIYALFLPGMWHRDAFLYKQDDGRFCGSDMYAEYEMSIEGNVIVFSVNGTEKKYSVTEDDNIRIFENDKLVFEGTSQKFGDFTMLNSADGIPIDVIGISVGGVTPSNEELYPNYTKIYNWYSMQKLETRGEAYMLIIIALIVLLLFVDIRFPDLFFKLKYGIMVDGGEPSDCYRTGQVFGRIILSITILICIIASFNIK